MREENPFKNFPDGAPFIMNAPEFVYWIFDYSGHPIREPYQQPTGTTHDLAREPKLKTVGNIGSGIKPLQTKKGDIVFFNGDKHVGVSMGDGKFIAFNGSGSLDYSGGIEKRRFDVGYYRSIFEGHVMRMKKQ